MKIETNDAIQIALNNPASYDGNVVTIEVVGLGTFTKAVTQQEIDQYVADLQKQADDLAQEIADYEAQLSAARIRADDLSAKRSGVADKAAAIKANRPQ